MIKLRTTVIFMFHMKKLRHLAKITQRLDSTALAAVGPKSTG